jgi:hypothetical protein
MNDPPNNQFFALQILVYGWGIITIFHDIVWTADVSAARRLSLPAIADW